MLSRSLVPLLLLAAAGCFAQPATPPEAGPGCGPGASAAECGPGAAWPRAGRHGRYGPEYAPGWSLMDPAERDEYRQQMLGAKTASECRSVVAEHHAVINERARARGLAPVPGPRRDPCAGLPG